MAKRKFRYVTMDVPVFYDEGEEWSDRLTVPGRVHSVTVEYSANEHNCGKGEYCPEYGERFIMSERRHNRNSEVYEALGS